MLSCIMVRCRSSELNRFICLPGLVYLLKLKEEEEESIYGKHFTAHKNAEGINVTPDSVGRNIGVACVFVIPTGC